MKTTSIAATTLAALMLAALQPGDVVVTSGVLQISAGQKVRTISTEQSAGGT